MCCKENGWWNCKSFLIIIVFVFNFRGVPNSGNFLENDLRHFLGRALRLGRARGPSAAATCLGRALFSRKLPKNVKNSLNESKQRSLNEPKIE